MKRTWRQAGKGDPRRHLGLNPANMGELIRVADATR